jgi:hypoxanthine phosphoribosyltransferase
MPSLAGMVRETRPLANSAAMAHKPISAAMVTMMGINAPREFPEFIRLRYTIYREFAKGYIMRREDAPKQEVLSWADVDTLIDQLLPHMTGAFDLLIMITRGGIIPGGLIAEALNIKSILTAAVEFPAGDAPRLLAWPSFLQFPDEELTRGRRVLIVDDVWTHGRHIMTVRGRVEATGARVETAVLHYKPAVSLFPNHKPTYYAAVTDAFIVYPWEVDRKPRMTRVMTPVEF